jgi:putative YphP/YqiW family bacilliredoxin
MSQLAFKTQQKYLTMYPAELVAPMAQQLTDNGFNSLKTAAEVEDVLSQKDRSVLVVVNSVCGCAAANARPGALMSLQGDKTPDQQVTVFAGVDREAVDKAREFMLPYPPSSPAIALFKDGRLVHMLERHHIEGRPAEMIADNLRQAYNAYC